MIRNPTFIGFRRVMWLDTILGKSPALFNGGLLLVNINHMNICMNVYINGWNKSSTLLCCWMNILTSGRERWGFGSSMRWIDKFFGGKLSYWLNWLTKGWPQKIAKYRQHSRQILRKHSCRRLPISLPKLLISTH